MEYGVPFFIAIRQWRRRFGVVSCRPAAPSGPQPGRFRTRRLRRRGWPIHPSLRCRRRAVQAWSPAAAIPGASIQPTAASRTYCAKYTGVFGPSDGLPIVPLGVLFSYAPVALQLKPTGHDAPEGESRPRQLGDWPILTAFEADDTGERPLLMDQ